MATEMKTLNNNPANIELVNRNGNKIEYSIFKGHEPFTGSIRAQPGAGQTLESYDEWLKCCASANFKTLH